MVGPLGDSLENSRNVSVVWLSEQRRMQHGRNLYACGAAMYSISFVIVIVVVFVAAGLPKADCLQ